MEEQLQHEKERVECFKPHLEQKVELLTKNIDNLVIEQESLQLTLNQKVDKKCYPFEKRLI